MGGRRRRTKPARKRTPSRPQPAVVRFVVRWWKWLTAGGVATIATIVTLTFTLFPSVKPAAPCPAQGADLSNVVAVASVTRGHYLDLLNASKAGIPAARLAERGELIRFDIRTRGYLDEPLTVATRILTPEAAPVTGPGLNNPIALVLRPEKCEDEGQRTIWTSLPRRPGRYLIDVRLLDPKGEALPSPPPHPVTVPLRRAS